MNKLTHIPYKIWILFSSFVAASIIFMIICFSFKVESTIKTNIMVKGWNDTSFLIGSQDIYKIQKENIVSVIINKKAYSGMITDIEYDDETKMFNMRITNLGINLIPNTTLEATIIYGVHNVFDEIFGSV